MKCETCDTSAVEGAKFCGQCGSTLAWGCVDCATDNDAKNRFCHECGAPRGESKSALLEQSDSDEAPDGDPVRVSVHGERRHMTLMFCDLVGSTSMSGELDPEELRALVLAYQEVAVAAIEGGGGCIGNFMGDGIIAYFGYPIADEQASVHAVRVGVQIVDAVAELRQDYPELEVRVGLHSGVTVVSDMGAGDTRQLHDVIGDTPNIAARVEGAAKPGTVAVSRAVRDECEGFIEFRSLGRHELKGVAKAHELFTPVGDTGATDRFDLASAEQRLTPMVGRNHEFDRLVGAWRRTQLGDPQVVWVSGEPGIGKTRLVRELVDRVRADGGIDIEFRCSTLHQSSSLYAVAEYLRRSMVAASGEISLGSAEQFADECGTQRELAVPVIADLLGIPVLEHYRSVESSADRVRQHTLDVLTQLIEARAERQPVLLVVDDIQWIDDTSAELIQRFIGPDQASEVMAIVTHRSNYTADIPASPHHEQVDLERLSTEDVESIIYAVAGTNRRGRDLVGQISERAEGVPLFVEELTHLVLASATDLVPSVPATLSDSLLARIDRLGPEADLLRVLSIIGREAPEGLLREVSGLSQAQFLLDVNLLLESGMIVRRGIGTRSVYRFRHVLQQEVAYRSMLRSSQKQLHARVADVLEQRFIDRSVTEPEVLARHLQLAGEAVRALPYYLRAGERAIAISAHGEALTHLRLARTLLEEFPDGGQRDAYEMEILVSLGVPTTATLGYGSPEADELYERAQELSGSIGDNAHVYSALYGLFRTRLLQAEYDKAEQLAGRLRNLADASPDRVELTVGSRRATGSLMFYVGLDQRAALEHLQFAMSAPDADRPGAYLRGLNDVVDPIVACHSYAAWSSWIVGSEKTARRLSDNAMAVARRLDHPFTLGLALCFDAWLCQFEGDSLATIERAEQGLAHAEEHGYLFWVGWAKVLLAWGESQQEGVSKVEEMRSGLTDWQAQGSRLGMTYFLGLVAHAEASSGDLFAAKQTLHDALVLAEDVGEHFWEAELMRLQAEVQRGLGSPTQKVDDLLRAAAACAAEQGAGALGDRIDASRARSISEFEIST